MERNEWDIVYPPIHEEVNRRGETIYVVVLSDQTETIQFVDPGVSREEAHERVRELLRDGLRDGRYRARDFYPQDANDMQLPRDAVDWHGMDEPYEQHCFGVAPASTEAVVGLPETSMKEGECSVCLENFDAGNSKLRTMPCNHSFHEQCIFNWLRINHVCPLCRFPLPTEQQ
ncbi:unnamed protein product [Urochloa decumbens]|uniref:RING-type domain-containing protein n=1 Tax=Urochloa decumbens TaxID=240449 RepID=A0ABC9GRK4_9POAL